MDKSDKSCREDVHVDRGRCLGNAIYLENYKFSQSDKKVGGNDKFKGWVESFKSERFSIGDFCLECGKDPYRELNSCKFSQYNIFSCQL